MIKTHTLAKTVLAIAAFAATVAFAQTETTTDATVDPVLTVSVSESNLTLEPVAGGAAKQGTMNISFASNDGSPHVVSLEAVAWTVDDGTGTGSFEPVDTANTDTPYLQFVQSATEDAEAVTTAADLITSGNAPATVEVVKGITNVSGEATVTVSSSAGWTVDAGTYRTTLTYTIN